MIAIMMMMGLKAKIVDIETAFLHGDLEEEIYMDAPEGIGVTEDKVVKLEQTIYGLVQSARQFWKKANQRSQINRIHRRRRGPLFIVQEDQERPCLNRTLC